MHTKFDGRQVANFRLLPAALYSIQLNFSITDPVVWEVEVLKPKER